MKARLKGSSHPVRPSARDSMRDKEILVVSMLGSSKEERDLKVEDDSPESSNQASSVSSETEEKVSNKDIPAQGGKRQGEKKLTSKRLNLEKSGDTSVQRQSSVSSLASSDGTVKPAVKQVTPS